MASLKTTMAPRLAGSRIATKVASSRRPLTVVAAKKSVPYVCIDCGYIYDGAKPFAELPSSYRCPVCQAPKRRFKEFAGAGRGNDSKTMGARREKLKANFVADDGKDDDNDQLLSTLVTYGGAALALLGGLYFFLQNRTAGL